MVKRMERKGSLTMYLPKQIADFLSGAKITPAGGGMSAANVFRCECQKDGKQEVYYLKTELWRESVANEHLLYRWLFEKRRLPIPEPLFCVEEECPLCEEKEATKTEHKLQGNRYGYLLIRKAKGENLCTPKYYADPKRLARLAAEGIKQLWQVDTTNCPVRVCLGNKLKIAEERLRRGGYRELNSEVPYTKDFRNHAEVFDFLVKNQPKVTPVFTHGDYCLDNFFTDGEHVTALIDFGNGGVGDAYQDIALCVREFSIDCPGAVSEFYKSLGITEPDEEKLRYYMLLDEMF